MQRRESAAQHQTSGGSRLLHAWTSNEVFLIHGDQEYLHDVEPVAGDDAIDVGWFTREEMQKLDIFGDHSTYIAASFERILQRQQETFDAVKTVT